MQYIPFNDYYHSVTFVSIFMRSSQIEKLAFSYKVKIIKPWPTLLLTLNAKFRYLTFSTVQHVYGQDIFGSFSTLKMSIAS